MRNDYINYHSYIADQLLYRFSSNEPSRVLFYVLLLAHLHQLTYHLDTLGGI